MHGREEFEQVFVEFLRLFQIGYVSGVIDDPQHRTPNDGMHVFRLFYGRQDIFSAAEDQRGYIYFI